MDINGIIDRLNNELEKLNNLKNSGSVNTTSFFTDNESFNDDLDLNNIEKSESVSEIDSDILDNNISKDNYSNIEPDNETVSLVTLKERHISTIQNMFKKSIRISLKSFLISITLSFLNLFI